MAEGDDFRGGPNALHPEQPSAVGSRNSLNRDGRDEYVEARAVIDEEVDKILNHIHSKLPPEAMQDMNVMGNIKSHLHTYFNQTFQNMANRYLTTAEDELGKKVRGLIDKEEHRTLNRYTPREIAELLNQVGGVGLFNTEEVEKSIVNIAGHLQGHLQRGTYDFESATNDILMQHTDVGGFVRGNNTYSVVKCSFRDHFSKPDKVVDVKLALNVLDSELISPVISHQMLSEHLIKDVIGKQIQRLIEREIEEINSQLSLESRPELSPHEAVFEKIKAIDNYTDDDDSANSKRYTLLPQAILDRLRGLTGESEQIEYDPLTVRQSVARMLEDENIRTMGWNTAVNSITGILDRSRMGYQHAENYKGARKLIIREYEDTDLTRLPDERFHIVLAYYDHRQIQAEKAAYSAQLLEFKREIMRLWNVVEAAYQEEKSRIGRQDWDDLMDATINRDRPGAKRGWFQGSAAPMEEEEERVWDEVTFVQRRLTSLEEMNQSYEVQIIEYKNRLKLIREKVSGIFGFNVPDHRVVIEQRLNFLEVQFLEFMSLVNPYHVQPGLVLDFTMTSIKRLRVTISGMANVLNEFLLAISQGFQDISMEHHEKRRSHVGSVDMSFDEQVD
ncbi:MAG: cytoplasmic filament protein CfpA [SAR324 cluster bacterium]|nr:cytoplasmic filament protein CfpA [SAR324 cluster bacterium]